METIEPQGRARWTGEVTKREQQGGEGKNGTLENWRRARKSYVQNIRELTVDLQSPGEKREKKRWKKKRFPCEEASDTEGSRWWCGDLWHLPDSYVSSAFYCSGPRRPSQCKLHLLEDLRETLVQELSPAVTGKF